MVIVTGKDLSHRAIMVDITFQWRSIMPDKNVGITDMVAQTTRLGIIEKTYVRLEENRNHKHTQTHARARTHAAHARSTMVAMLSY